MVTLTRSEAKAALSHVMKNVLGRDDASPLHSALEEEGIGDIFDFITLTDSIIDDLKYEDTSNPGTYLPIKKGDKGLIRCFLAYDQYMDKQGLELDFAKVTQQEFDNYRISPAYRSTIQAQLPKPATVTPPVVSSSTTSSHASNYSPVAMFRRSIKKDPSLFPTLKDDKYHDTWHRSFNTQAMAQDVSDVLNETYVPVSLDDIALFAEKQKYVYAVLESKVLTDRGKSIIRDHEHDFDAQKVYQKIKSYHLKSTKAKMESSVILSYITSSKLGDGTWNGSTESFIINWQNQVRLYEKHVPPDDHFSEGQKRIMLQNAVNDIDKLRQVKNTADHMATTSGSTLSYDEYTTLLLSAATAYDEKFKPAKVKRQVLMHDIADNYDSVDEAEVFGIDSPVSNIQAYATNFHNKQHGRSNNSKVRMSSEKWFKLDDNSKAIWDQLDDKSKAIILGYQSSDASLRGTTSATNSSGKPSFGKMPFGKASSGKPAYKPQVNLHEISAYDFLVANMHDLETTDNDPNLTSVDAGDPSPDEDVSDTRLINAAKSNNKSSLPPGDIRRVMSKSSTRLANHLHLEYHVSFHKASSNSALSLIDRGANGGVAGDDVRVIFRTNRTVDIKGIDNHHVNNIGIGTVGGVVDTQHGPVIAIMHQYALLGKGASIHSPCQLEWYKNDVNDKSTLVPGGLQRIQTLDGYIIPLAVKDGLARLAIRPYTDKEFESLPHVFLTSELEWDPTVLDHEHTSDFQWGESKDPHNDLYPNKRFDEFGNYRQRVTVHHLSYFQRQDGTDIDDMIDQCVLYAHNTDTGADALDISPTSLTNDETPRDTTVYPIATPKMIHKKDPDYAQLRPFFGWLSTDVVQKTFQNSTQYARLPSGTTLKRAFKSPNPALNVTRRNEPVACDIVYADVPAIDNGSTAAVLFVGTETQVTDVYGIKTDKQFVNTLEDNITNRGAPHKLISDSAQVIISHKVHDILRTLCITSWQSEPHQQQQNAAERRYQTVKRAANRIMDRSGAPDYTWLLCLHYVCYLLNHSYNDNIKGIPLTHLTGVTVDISALLRFHFWQKVYYKKVDCSFPSTSVEEVGHIVGISEHCGNALTYKILNLATNKVINRSLVRPALPDDLNLRAELLGGEINDCNDIIKGSKQHTTPNPKEPSADPPSIPIINPDELIGRTFLMDQQENGTRFRGRIVELINDHTSKVEGDTSRIKFLVSVNDDTKEEVITYNQLLEFLEKDESNDIVWKFHKITSHQGPLSKGHPDYKGSMYNVMIEWENGEITSEPLHIISKDDPVTCAIYARENGLLNTPGWKQFKSIAKRQKKFTRMVNQAKLRSFNAAPKYKNGFEIPRSYKQAIGFDEKNKNTKWQDAVALELQQINEYDTFIDQGHHTKATSPTGYKKIKVHFVFDVKHDGRHKARLVADGQLLDIPLESVYSGVVSLQGFRLVLFLAELNGLELWATDIGNAYLEAYTSEKVFIIAGPEFKDLEGHILIISKALYGLRSSGARWHDRFSDCMSGLGFFPCKAEPDIWMRKSELFMSMLLCM